MKFIILPLLAAVTFLTSCGSSVSSLSAHEKFKARKDYVKTYDTFKASNLSSTKRSATSIVINKSTQRIQLLDNEKVVLDAPCPPGKAGKRPPSGTFRITEKIVDKRSTISGSCYKNGVKVCGGDRRKCRRSYNKYVGASLPYWQRLTGDGIGMHSSGYVKRYPGSNGCIRLQPSTAKLIFSKTYKGTRVKVVN